MQKVAPIEITFIADGESECGFCGLSSFSHVHPKGSLPKKFINLGEIFHAKGERIKCAAVALQSRFCVDGFEIFEGKTHAACIDKARHEVIKSRQGFMTTFERFVDRKQAARIAYAEGQIKEPIDELYSEDLFSQES